MSIDLVQEYLKLPKNEKFGTATTTRAEFYQDLRELGVDNQLSLINDFGGFLLDKIAIRTGKLVLLKEVVAKQDAEIQQLLGVALGYPRYCDDPTNFPDSTETDGVCVGEHVSVTLAAEIAAKIKALRGVLEQIRKIAADRAEIHMEVARQASVERDIFTGRMQCAKANQWQDIVNLTYAVK